MTVIVITSLRKVSAGRASVVSIEASGECPASGVTLQVDLNA